MNTEIYVKTVKKYPFGHCVVMNGDKVDSIHYVSSHAYNRAKFLKTLIN